MKTIGIIGGMGPLSTVDLFEKIVKKTGALRDQDHIPVLIDNNTRIPDRTEAILMGGESPLPELLKSARRLEGAGADFLIMGCNTAHYYYDQLKDEVKIPFLNMVTLTAEEGARKGWKTLGLLATKGTVDTKLYQRALEEVGISCILPEKEDQESVQRLIYEGIKMDRFPEGAFGVPEVAKSLFKGGACGIILGCTELSVAAGVYHWDFPYLDPTCILAQEAIRMGREE